MPDSNMGLEDVLLELTKYGNPTMHGNARGGGWRFEVDIRCVSYEAAGRPPWWFHHHQGAPAGFSHVGWRMIGSGATPAAAARELLERCVEKVEGPCRPYMSLPLDEETARAEG